MRPSKQNISKKQIELEIYKTFEQFKKEKSIRIDEFLNKFDVTLFQSTRYRSIYYAYGSFIKLVLYQKLKGIKFHTKLTKYLRRKPSIRWKLGFSKTPDRTQIGYFINHILDEDTKEQLDFTASMIEEVSERFGILLDVKTFEPEKPQKQTKERNQYLQKKKKHERSAVLSKKGSHHSQI